MEPFPFHSGEKKFLPRQDSNLGPLAFKTSTLPQDHCIFCVMSGLKIREFSGLQEMRKYIFSASSIADGTW